MGYSHPDHLLNELTAYQLAEWEAFDKIDPIGSFRADYRMASICTTVTNLAIKMNSKSKNPKLTSPVDFLPDWDGSLKERKNKKMSTEELKSALLAIASAQNDKVAKEHKLHNRKPMKRR